VKTLQILGTGCPKCMKLAESAEAAAKRLGIAYRMEKITEITKIMSFGVMSTPALAVDGAVKFSGKVPTPEEIERILGEEP
jgi:small redox-active disulfide protein 2